MKSAAVLFLLLFFVSFHCLGQGRVSVKSEKQTPVENGASLCFPLQHDDIYAIYSYIIDLRDNKVQRKYQSLFSKYNYEFTGYVWASILRDIIRNADDKEIADHVFVKGQENILTFTITQYQVRERFPQFICPILSDIHRFEKYIKAADRHKVKNY